MYKYLLDENKNQFYPLIDDKSIINVNTVNDFQIEELFNPTVEDILIEDEYRFSVSSYPRASIGVECIPERAGKQAYLDVTTSNPDCCNVAYIDGGTIFLNTNRRGESTITITETNSGISKETKVFIQGVPRLYAHGSGPLSVSSVMIQESVDEAVYRVEAWPYDSGNQFSRWSDGSTENPREITIYDDTELTAYYKPVLCKVEVRSSNNDWGTVRGGGSVRYGGNFMIKAIPNSGYLFVQWSDGDTNPERKTWASGDVVYEAIFEEINPNQVIYYTANDDQIVNPNAYRFGANLIENTYTNGQGMMVFDGNVTTIGDSVFTARTSLASITIPDSVTSIEEYAFSNCTSLTSVTIPNSVTSIGDAAFFYCSGLTSITIPNSVTSIGYAAFAYCSSLTSVTIGNSVTSIGHDAFNDCSSLTFITIPNSVTSIGENAFYECSSLTSVTINSDAIVNKAYTDSTLSHIFGSQVTEYIIGDNVKGIGDGAFFGCTSLTSVTIGNSVTSIGDNAFMFCSSLTSITIPNSVTSIGNYAFRNCSSLTSITIPNSVTSIGEYAFSNCSSLTSINIPNSVTSIGDNAFEDCTSLTSMTIPNSVISIGYRAFSGCSKLTSVTIPNSVTSIGDFAFMLCPSLTSVNITDLAAWCNIDFEGNNANPLSSAHNLYLNGELVKDLVIPNSVTSIGNSAFYNCSSLTSVTIDNSVTSIGEHAFEFCSSLTSITIPNSVTSIGTYAFLGCESLTSITIPNGVTSIGKYTFQGCSSLTSITIPNSVTSIGGYAFAGCSSLTSVTIPNSVISIGDSAFDGCSSLETITCAATTPPTLGAYNDVSSVYAVYVPAESIEAYKTATNWSYYSSKIQPIPS